MLKRTIIIGILLLVGFQIHAETQLPPELREAMQARQEAVWKKDTLAWDPLTADEFTI
jgi:hypothetical protein